jgi:hypothetical protein
MNNPDHTSESLERAPDPGSGMGNKSGSGSGTRIRDEQPGSYFREHRNHFLGVKILKFFDADPGWKKFGSEITFRIRNTGIIFREFFFCERSLQFYHLNALL